MSFSLKSFFATKSSALKTPKSAVGIDFGSTSVKVVEIEQREAALALKTYGELQLGPYGKKDMGATVSLEAKQKTEVLVDVLRESGASTEAGVMALPLSSSFVTVISFAANAKMDEDLSGRVRVEARKYIPVPLSDVTLDWSELPPLGQESETIREVLVAAIQNEPLNQMNDLSSQVLKGSRVSEIELFSALRPIIRTGDSSLAIIDLGGSTSKLYIIQDGLLRKLHRVPTGGMMATERVAELLSVPFSQAENIKRNYDPASESADEIKKSVTSTFERPFQEFKRALGQHEARIGQPFDRVVITGGSIQFPDLPDFAKYVLDRPVERAAPFNRIAYPAFMEDFLTEIGPVFTVALGAALRKFESS